MTRKKQVLSKLEGTCFSGAFYVAPLLFFVFFPSPFTDNIPRPALGFHVDFPHIFADHTQTHQLDATHEANDTHGGGPAADGGAGELGDEGPENTDEAEDGYGHTETGDHPDGFDGEAGDAVEGQGQHLFQRIVALPGDALCPLVVDRSTLKAHQGDHATEEDIHFFKVGELLEDPAADQAVVSVIEDHFCPHPVHQLVEALGGKALEEGVCVPLAADTVDYLTAV